MAQEDLRVYKDNKVVLALQDLQESLVNLDPWVQSVRVDRRALLGNLAKTVNLVEMEILVKWDLQDLRELEGFLGLLVSQA